MEASITLKNVSKSFGEKHLFGGLTLGVEKGSSFAVIGKNGAGKSVLLKLFANWTVPDSGTIFIRGEEVSKKTDLLRDIAYLPENDAHDPWLTGWKNIYHRAELLGMNAAVTSARVEPLIELFQMRSVLDDFPVTYSRGTKRCLDLILTLLQPAEIIILDEPMLGLDYCNRWALLQYLLQIKSGVTMIIASSQFTEIHTLADRWIILDRGTVRFDGTMAKMLTKLELPFTLELQLQQRNEQIKEALSKIEGVTSIDQYGLLLKLTLQEIATLPTVLNAIDLSLIAGINGYTISVEDFINRLLAVEGE